MMTPLTRTPDAAPAADTADAPAARPLAWSIMQWMAAVAVPCLVVGGTWLALWLGPQASSRGTGSIEAFIFGIFGPLAAWALAIHLTTRRRMPIARWVGGAFIVLLILVGMLCMWDGLSHGELNDPGTVLALAGILVCTLLACLWLHAFAFAAKVKRYLGLA